jgi:PAS domain-containing protein
MKKDGNPSAFSPFSYRENGKLRSVSRQESLNYVSSPEEMHRIIHKMARLKIELEKQNGALLQQEEELKESLNRYAGLYNYAPIGYLRLARDSTIFEINLMGARILGVDRFLLKSDRFVQFIASEDLPVFNALLERVFSLKEQCSCVVRLLNDQQSRAVSEPSAPPYTGSMSSRTIRVDAVVSEDGQECMAVLSDITMQNRIEQERALCRNHGFRALGSTTL